MNAPIINRLLTVTNAHKQIGIAGSIALANIIRQSRQFHSRGGTALAIGTAAFATASTESSNNAQYIKKETAKQLAAMEKHTAAQQERANNNKETPRNDTDGPCVEDIGAIGLIAGTFMLLPLFCYML